MSSALRGLLHVELATPERDWQETWKKLFDLLRARGVTVTELPSASAFPEKDLIKDTLASCPVFNDGEHIDLAAANLPEAAEALAATLRARLNDKNPGKIILLRAEQHRTRWSALSLRSPRFGMPQPLYGAAFCSGPSPDLRLKLLPFDPETLRQFLLLPVCPVEAELRRNILHALRYTEFAPADEKFDSWPSLWKKAFLGDTDAQTKKFKAQVHWICPPQRVKKEPISPSASPNLPELWKNGQRRRRSLLSRRQPNSADVSARPQEASTPTFRPLL